MQDNHRRWTSRRSERQSISLKRWIFQRATKTQGCQFSRREPNHLQRHDGHVFRCFWSSCWAGDSQLHCCTLGGSYLRQLYDQSTQHRYISGRFYKNRNNVENVYCTATLHIISYYSDILSLTLVFSSELGPFSSPSRQISTFCQVPHRLIQMMYLQCKAVRASCRWLEQMT